MNHKKQLLRYIVSVSFVFLLATGLSAQIVTGNIKGTVTDEEGTPLPGVSVELSSPSLMGECIHR